MSPGSPSSEASAPEEDLFFRALELPEAEREAFLVQSCAADASLRSAVEALLDDHSKATAFFTDATQRLELPQEEAPRPLLEPGSLIGPYRILRLLGEGGGGIVYEAEQELPVRRRVALKLLKLGTDQVRVMAQFEVERQTLALMEHPNVARVLDAGVTDSGFPYLVMELVRGTRITDYCRENQLPPDARLRLMHQVCAAVQHAHQKGIIHHDLKPSNILVSEIDGVPVPKVIDFGISIILDTRLGERRGGLPQGHLAGTPAYMSPEQLQGRIKDVDTRSDVYSLGVITYELLAGRPPLGSEEPSRPDVGGLRLRGGNGNPVPPSRLGVRLRPELDLIVLKSLERDRERRYSTVRALAADLENYLAHRPVEAHLPSAWYRFQKLVRRNRLVATAGTFAVLALCIGFTTSTVLYFRARTAEQQQARLRAEAEEREHVARAAILLMQSRTQEADAEIRLMGGGLTQPSVEASQVFHSLGLWSAMNGDWKTSASRWLALSRVNRFDDQDMTDNATRDLLPVAPTLIESGDLATFYEFRGFLIARLRQTNNPIAAEQVLKICLQLPASREFVDGIGPIAEVAVRSLPGDFSTKPRDWLEAWRCIVVGLWHLRAGRFEEAAHWCDRGLLLRDDEEARRSVGLLVRGLARLRSGAGFAAAREDIAVARDLVQRRFASRLDYGSGGYWHDWLSARILLRETDAPEGVFESQLRQEIYQ